MYSSHRIDSVTCLRRSSRCTAAQSGSACRRWPRRVPGPAPALANSRASSTASVMSSGNGQVSPAASNRWIVNLTVEGAVPNRRAISRVGIPADFNLITSRTWRIASLSVGIQVPLRKAERRDRIGARRGLVTPGRHHPGMVGEIISEWRARSNRNGGRDHSGMVGDIERNQQSGWEVVKVYEDSGISGAKGRDKRPGLDAMMKAVNAKEFDMAMFQMIGVFAEFERGIIRERVN